MSAAAPPLVTILRESWRQWWSPDWMLPCAGPGWLRLVWTFLFNCAIAIVLALAAWGFARRGNFLQSLQWKPGALPGAATSCSRCSGTW